ncbi:MAG: class I SAM-dependent methyltransferase, partial [Candidatus Omnitrophica bacterium]|nr:class I SAM-dependent methyltransferase [Candidatus Omnitrophota bacterium]
PYWVKAMMEPVLEEGKGLVLPHYVRPIFDGMITKFLMYIWAVAFYRLDIEQIIAGDFCLSGEFVDKILEDKKLWQDKDFNTFGYDNIVTSLAIVEAGVEIIRVALGEKLHNESSRMKERVINEEQIEELKKAHVIFEKKTGGYEFVINDQTAIKARIRAYVYEHPESSLQDIMLLDEMEIEGRIVKIKEDNLRLMFKEVFLGARKFMFEKCKDIEGLIEKEVEQTEISGPDYLQEILPVQIELDYEKTLAKFREGYRLYSGIINNLMNSERETFSEKIRRLAEVAEERPDEFEFTNELYSKVFLKAAVSRQEGIGEIDLVLATEVLWRGRVASFIQSINKYAEEKMKEYGEEKGYRMTYDYSRNLIGEQLRMVEVMLTRYAERYRKALRKNGQFDGGKEIADSPKQFVEWLKQLKNLQNNNQKILSLASGEGFDELFFAEKGFDVVASDISKGKVEFIQNKAETRNINIEVMRIGLAEELPFRDNSFDAVYIRLGFHYLPNKELIKIASGI